MTIQQLCICGALWFICSFGAINIGWRKKQREGKGGILYVSIAFITIEFVTILLIAVYAVVVVLTR